MGGNATIRSEVNKYKRYHDIVSITKYRYTATIERTAAFCRYGYDVDNDDWWFSDIKDIFLQAAFKRGFMGRNAYTRYMDTLKLSQIHSINPYKLSFSYIRKNHFNKKRGDK